MSQPMFIPGKVSKRKAKQKIQKQIRRAVKTMLEVMETPGEKTQDVVSEFLGTGRTGRRNALPDILGPNAQTSCSDLPDRLQSLCSVVPKPGSSKSGSVEDGTYPAATSSTPQPGSESTQQSSQCES